jgi:hypothetical protein
MAALLTSVGDDKDKMAIYLAECRSMGIKVLPPDVNTSVRDFAPVGTDIRFGLSAVRNVGTGVVASIVASRRDKGDYTDFYDFLEKVDQVACNKKVVESLIKAGAYDSLGHPRKGLLMEHARAIDEVLGLKKAEAIGQFDLFGEMSQEEKGDSFRGSVPDTEWDTKLRLGFEREMLGLYVSGHPLAGVEHILSAQSGRVDPGHPGRHHPGPRGGHGRWDPDRAAAPADQEGRPLGVRHPGGPGRRGRGRVLPEGVLGLLVAAGRGRDRAGQGAGGPLRGPALAARPAGGDAGPVGVGGQGAGAGQHRGGPLHPARRGSAA